MSFYNRTSNRCKPKHTWLARAGAVAFGLTLGIALFDAFRLKAGWWKDCPGPGHLLATMAIVLPAIGAALAGIRVHREYLRNSERYAHMARHLSRSGEQIKKAGDMEKLIPLLQEANELMLRENQDWRVVFLFQKLEAP